MDEFQLAGVIAVSAAVGYVAATVKYTRQMRVMHQAFFSNNVESITRMCKAAIATLVDDYKLPEDESAAKFFARCGELGMALVRVDPKTGESTAVTKPEVTKS